MRSTCGKRDKTAQTPPIEGPPAGRKQRRSLEFFERGQVSGHRRRVKVRRTRMQRKGDTKSAE